MIHICLNLINFWFTEFNLLLYYYYERIRIHIFVYLYYSIEFLPVRLEFCFTVNFYTIQSVTLSRIMISIKHFDLSLQVEFKVIFTH